MDPLSKLAAEADIRNLLGHYVHLVDSRRLDECESLFADNAVLEVMGEIYQGRPEIRRWLDTLAASGPPGKHMVGNHVISVDAGDALGCVSDFMVFKDTDGRWASTTRGAYHDSFVYHDHQLRFQRRRIEVLFAKPTPKTA